jgi:hypothetical protein
MRTTPWLQKLRITLQRHFGVFSSPVFDAVALEILLSLAVRNNMSDPKVICHDSPSIETHNWSLESSFEPEKTG